MTRIKLPPQPKPSSLYKNGKRIKTTNVPFWETNINRCQRCGIFRWGLPSGIFLERHHKIPLSMGGQDVKQNIEMLCSLCHISKHPQYFDLMAQKFLKHHNKETCAACCLPFAYQPNNYRKFPRYIKGSKRDFCFLCHSKMSKIDKSKLRELADEFSSHLSRQL